MGSVTDPASFAARRSAASNLPNFQLPPPELSHMQRFPPLSAVSVSQSAPMSAGNLLTPPTNLSGDVLSPISSSVNSGNSGSSNQAALPPYTPLNFWPPPLQSGSPYSFGSGPGPLAGFTAQAPTFPARSIFSPSLSSLGRNASSPSSGDNNYPLPPPPYDLSLPPFATSMPVSAQGAPMSSSNLPDLAAQQRAMTNALMSNPTPVTSTTTQASPVHAHESYPNQRLPPTPTYYNASHPASAPPHQTTFPNPFNNSSPNQPSPGSAVTGQRVSPLSAGAGPTHPPILHPAPTPSANSHQSRPLGYSLPAMAGPVMSNVHSPGSQMALVGGMPGGSMIQGYSSHGNLSQMYGGHGHAPPPPPQNDRPFKCDQCAQSFNRNHDLKRHKRIHLAVKPFPCGHCEKSFSRKDALKRHILVKGCGKGQAPDGAGGRDDGSSSPLEKADLGSSDEADESPVLEGSGARPGSR
ncbi:MAG: hypothetical protein M1838_001254 [Thelocarpon superellum]|nr:MAG: hypothetical protein M1838_001254 [Thelocarpon superellum]